MAAISALISACVDDLDWSIQIMDGFREAIGDPPISLLCDPEEERPKITLEQP